MNYLADKSYLAVEPQVDATTPRIPSYFIPLISESIRLNPNYAADRRMKGIDWKSDELLKGSRTVEGDLVFYGDPDALGHALNMMILKGVTTGDAASGYTHPFGTGEGRNYSIEIPRGNYAQRIYGVRGDNLKMSFQDNKLLLTLSIKALGQFYTNSLAVALVGAGQTSLQLSTDYDLNPTKGLCAGDIVVAGGVNITITSVDADGKTLHFGAIAVTAAIGDPVYLKAQTPTFATLAEPLYMGNALVGVGDDETEATTNAGAKSTATPAYDFSIDLKNNLLSEPASGSTGPSVILNQVKEGAITMKRLFENPQQAQKWVENIKQAITAIFTGRFIDTGHTISEKMTAKFYKIKLMTNEQPLDTGAYIFDSQTFEVLYDSGAGKAIEITVINKTSGDDYGDNES